MSQPGIKTSEFKFVAVAWVAALILYVLTNFHLIAGQANTFVQDATSANLGLLPFLYALLRTILKAIESRVPSLPIIDQTPATTNTPMNSVSPALHIYGRSTPRNWDNGTEAIPTTNTSFHQSRVIADFYHRHSYGIRPTSI